MDKIFVIFFLFASSLSFGASKVLLKFEFGNQITRSYLTIFDNGTIERRERLQPGKPLVTSPEISLTETSKKQLTDALEAVEKGNQSTEPGNKTSLGSSSGSLVGYTAGGVPLTVRVITRGNGMGSRDTVKFSTTPEARWIEKLVNSVVERKMYLATKEIED